MLCRIRERIDQISGVLIIDNLGIHYTLNDHGVVKHIIRKREDAAEVRMDKIDILPQIFLL